MAQNNKKGNNIIAKKGEITWWNRAEMARYLEVDPSSLKHFIEKGAPDKVDGLFNVNEFCKFIVQMPKGRRGKSLIRTNALKFVMGVGEREKVTVAKAKTPVNNKKAKAATKRKVKKTAEVKVKKEAKKAKKIIITTEKVLGMTAALGRAKQAEFDAHQVYQQVFEKTKIIDVASLDAWQKTLEVLRKCETDFLKVMEKQKYLVEKSAVQSYLETMIENTKTMLLNLPSKMAPSLDGLPWQDIQKRLDIEVRDILEGLAKYE